MTLDDVIQAKEAIEKSGDYASADKILAHLGHGSKKTVLRRLRTLAAAGPPVPRATAVTPTDANGTMGARAVPVPRQTSTTPLTPRQRRFVDEYLVDLNGKQAAIRAGYSPKTAEVLASQTLRIPKVQAAITAAQARRSQRTAITQDTVLRELTALAQSDVTHYRIDEQGNVQLREGAPEGAMRAISSLKKRVIHTETAVIYETEIKLWNKPASVRMAGEHLGLFKGREQPPPDIHLHVDSARDRLGERLEHLATRHAEDATNGQ